MPRKTTLPYVKTVRAKGRTYLYFNTGKTDGRGRPIYIKLPPKDSPSFGATYAAMTGHRGREPDTLLTVPKLVELFEKSPKFAKYSAGTKKAYAIYLDEFRDQFATAPAGELERRDVVFIVDKRAATPGAANLLLKTIGTLYAWGRDRGHVTNDPTKDIATLPVGEHRAWPEDLLNQALASDDVRVRLATHILYYTAQRIGDACRLRWSDIRDGAIRLTQQKTGKELEIPLHGALRAELERHPKTLGTILKYRPGTIREAVQEFTSKRGYRAVPHGLRKNAVNALLEAGCSVAETAAISGQSLQLVEYYAKQRNQPKLGRGAVLKWERADGTK